MAVKEKLVELLADSVYENVELDDGYVGYEVNNEQIADYLIVHGVTVQEWISVKDRLPEEGECVIVYDTREDYIGMWEFSGVAWYNDDYNPLGIDEVTHWMPLPDAPKGE